MSGEDLSTPGVRDNVDASEMQNVSGSAVINQLFLKVNLSYHDESVVRMLFKDVASEEAVCYSLWSQSAGKRELALRLVYQLPGASANLPT